MKLNILLTSLVVISVAIIASLLYWEPFSKKERETDIETISVDVVETHLPSGDAISVPVVLQNPELPNGCEITSLTAVLQYYGVKTNKLAMADKYLPKQSIVKRNGASFGPNPYKAYTGNPRNANGWYVYAEPIAHAAGLVIKDTKLPLVAEVINNSTVETIDKLLENRVPVIVWVTLDLAPPIQKGGWYLNGTSTYYKAISNSHTVVILKSTATKVVVMDPIKGYVSHDKAAFFKSYEQSGKHALVVKRAQ